MSIFDFLNATEFKTEIAQLKTQNGDLKKNNDIQFKKFESEKVQLESKNDDLQKKLNLEIKALNAKIAQMKAQNTDLQKIANFKLSAQQIAPFELQKMVDQKNKQLIAFNKQLEINQALSSKKNQEIVFLQNKIDILREQTVDLSEELKYESYGLYKPKYDFATANGYREKLQEIRSTQKKMISEETAAEIVERLTMNNSDVQGLAMQRRNIKQILRAFNGEAEAAINKVTKSNIETIEKRIRRSFDQLSRLNKSNRVRLTQSYCDSKLDEARLALEYALKKEQEREILREQREREREEKQLQKEIAQERAKYQKDESHFEKAKHEVEEKIKESSVPSEVAALKNELLKLQDKLTDIQNKKEKLTDRAQNPTAGYVYIISNVGSFGQDVYKIGVTRRLDPMDRINELGSASVPFKFDVHALIFSDDAFKLEAELHNYFDRKRVNRVNKRKEYFKITMQDIKSVLAQHQELTFDFSETPEAQEYRDSVKLAQKQSEI